MGLGVAVCIREGGSPTAISPEAWSAMGDLASSAKELISDRQSNQLLQYYCQRDG